MQCILASHVEFIGITYPEYTYITFTNQGFTIQVINRDEFKRILAEEKLILVDPSEYRGQYDSALGRIYVDKPINLTSKQKQHLFKLLNHEYT